MKIQPREILIKDLYNGYKDNLDEGVVGYGGKLDIRPPYQREFVYGIKERDLVIDTVTKDYPLNVMYWEVKKDGNFAVIDGQQRIISICQYLNGDFSFKKLSFSNLPEDKQKQINNYKLTVYFCSGKPSEKLEWFRVINIAGKQLNEQERKNAVYSGPWVTDAKKYFSKINCPAYSLGKDYLEGSPIRQDYLETIIDWYSNGKIADYMDKHKQDAKATELREYFKDVIDWIENNFKNKKVMKGVEWGSYYNEFKNKKFNTKKIEAEVKKLILDDDVTKNKGIYPYLITGEEKHLSLRAFSYSQKLKTHEKQGGKCKKCRKPFKIEEMEADHIKAWSKGGKTTDDNCQMLCIKDHKLMKNK